MQVALIVGGLSAHDQPPVLPFLRKVVTLAKAGYAFTAEKAIPIPIYDNRDEAATHLWPILLGGSLKRSLGMVANARHWPNMYPAKAGGGNPQLRV